MAREMAADEVAVLMNAREPPLAECCACRAVEQRRLRAAEQMPGERPVHQAQRQLEAAAPMRPPPVRTLLEPRIQQQLTTSGELPVPGQMPCLRKGNQLRVPTRLPQILDVADQRFIAIVESPAVHQRRIAAGFRVAVPA